MKDGRRTCTVGAGKIFRWRMEDVQVQDGRRSGTGRKMFSWWMEELQVEDIHKMYGRGGGGRIVGVFDTGCACPMCVEEERYIFECKGGPAGRVRLW
jgi:hypothetical protein